jgi:hypothetical protein
MVTAPRIPCLQLSHILFPSPKPPIHFRESLNREKNENLLSPEDKKLFKVSTLGSGANESSYCKSRLRVSGFRELNLVMAGSASAHPLHGIIIN